VTDLLLGIGLVLTIEGLLYAAFPGAVKHMIEMIRDMPDQSLRISGIVVLAAGVVFVWLARG
jgi:uncharacterized protein